MSATNFTSFLLGIGLQQVLHMDRNDYYGGESTSLNLNQVKFLFLFLLNKSGKISSYFTVSFVKRSYSIEWFQNVVYSSGNDSGAATHHLKIWAQAKNTTLI